MQDSITLRRERARRRKNLMSAIGKGSIAIIPSAPTKLRSKDTDYKYRQDSDFFYLTGFEEPSSVAVLIAGRRAAEYIICLLYTSPSPRDRTRSRMPSSA